MTSDPSKWIVFGILMKTRFTRGLFSFGSGSRRQSIILMSVIGTVIQIEQI